MEFSDVALMYRGRRGDHLALEKLSFRVEKGEFIAVLGPSGCGKSTLLRLVSGLQRPTAGMITLDGTAIDRPRSDVGMVFQQPTLLPWNTVMDNVTVPTTILGQTGPQVKQRAGQLLDLVGLADFAKRYPFELSGGMQQRVGIARSLMHDPKMLLMDEPFAALDALTRESMTMELQALWQRSPRTVLFITHSIPEAVILADRILVMSRGPGRIVHEERVDVPRPRTFDSMKSANFMDVCDRLRHLFVH